MGKWSGFRRVVYDQALKVLAPREPPAVEKIFNLARKLNAELDGAGWKPVK